MKILFILGRQPEISQAELVAVFGADKIQAVAHDVVMINFSELSDSTTRDELLMRLKPQLLGGSIKLARVLHELPQSNWRQIINHVVDRVANTLPSSGKVTLGFSAYGYGGRHSSDNELTSRDVQRIGLLLKSKTKSREGSIRLVPNDAVAISSATAFHNRLGRSENKREIIVAKADDRTVIADTFFVQDITAYTLRDRGRPKRDARVGMLPPKLAQVMVNLATNGAAFHEDDQAADKKILLDPFVGTGVVLMEAALAGFDVYGTDLEPRMVDFTRANLEWLAVKFHTQFASTLEVGDATSHTWQTFDFVACETYLGQPFSAPPSPEKLNETRHTCDIIISKFLKNIATQCATDARLCVAIPAWFMAGKTFHLGCTNKLHDFGLELVRVSSKPLIYHRENQVVGREILVLRKR